MTTAITGKPLPGIGASTAHRWLDLLCSLVPNLEQAALFTDSGDVPLARWPADAALSPELAHCAHRALEQRKARIAHPPASDAPLHIACPVLIGGHISGVIAVAMPGVDEQHQRAVVQMLHRGAAWLQLLLEQQGQQETGRDADVLEALGRVVPVRDFTGSVIAAATELELLFDCSRVGIGLVQGGHVRLCALSGNASFNPRAQLVKQLESAMQHSLQGSATLTPESAEPESLPLCLPMPGSDLKPFAVVSFEPRQPLSPAQLDQLNQAIRLFAGVLSMKQALAAGWLQQIRDRLFGGARGGSLRNTVIGTALLGLVAAAFIDGNYRVAGDALLEGSVQRVVVAPMDGFLETASVRPGDRVVEGQLLGSLESGELELELNRWSGELAQYRHEYREALGDRDRAKIGILSARLAQAQAQVDLLQEKLDRTELVAPYAGIISDGDQSQKLGAPVERGQVLFTVAPLDSYRVVVRVDESEISHITVGQSGVLVLAAQPGKHLPLTVAAITPVSTAKDGRNYFRVEASLDAEPAALRPGLQGIAKIEVGERKFLWLWTHKLVEWLQMQFWLWQG